MELVDKDFSGTQLSAKQTSLNKNFQLKIPLLEINFKFDNQTDMSSRNEEKFKLFISILFITDKIFPSMFLVGEHIFKNIKTIEQKEQVQYIQGLIKKYQDCCYINRAKVTE